MMREPQFWWQEPGLPARLLAPCAAIYGAIAAVRLRRRGERAGVPVLCIGNLTVGGGGKTPSAIALANLILRAGLRPAFLTRGYGGRLAGPVRVDPAASAGEVGDEPLLLARIAPTILARDRAAGARHIAAASTDVIVMDDGLQNPSLIKDVALVALDGRRGIGNARVIPAGPLRAPLAAQLDRTDAVLLIGAAGESARKVVAVAERRGLPVFTARLEPSSAVVGDLRGRPILAYAGIADPGKFFATLAGAGCPAAVERGFPDHYNYTAADAARLLADAARDGLQLVTTEKDCARLSRDAALAGLAARSTALPVELVIEDAERLRAFLRKRTGLAL
jgi:tetraacyldisaccharide 4'-kinase